MYSLLKRCIDIFGASIGLLLLSPILITVAITILVTMGRPVFFKQTRPGYKGTPFEMIKFRTMREPRTDEIRFLSDADRITGVGKFLRKTSIDELPELFNVLKGDMSLVGPRPLLMQYLDKYTSEQARRHEVKPGITGWAQINGRQCLTFSQRFKLDVWYVDNRSIWLDIYILFLTIPRAIAARGVYIGQSVEDVDDIGILVAASTDEENSIRRVDLNDNR